MTAKDLYKVLGLAKDASETDIKKAYHQMAKKYHPDKNSDANAEEKFKEIGSAYETLKDASKRRTYDNERAGDEERARMRRQAPTSNYSSSSNHKSSSGGDTSGFSSHRPSGFTFKSSFNTFEDDDFFKRAREEFDNMTGNKKGKKKKASKPTSNQRKTFDFTRSDWDNNWNEETPKSARSNANKSDHRDKPHKSTFPNFMEDPFTKFDQMFDEFFGNSFFTASFGSRNGDHFLHQPQFKAQQQTPFGRNLHASEDNLFMRTPRRSQPSPASKKKEEEEEMYDWTKPMFGHKSYDSDSEYDYFDIEDDHGHILMKCTHCGRKFRPNILRKHEQVCEKWQQRRQKTPNSDEDRENFRFGDSPQPKKKDWRSQHEDLANNIHNARRMGRDSRSKSPPVSDEEIEEYIECRWCHRMFSESAARRHFPICEVRSTNYAGSTDKSAPSKSYRAKQYSKNIPKPNASRQGPQASTGTGGTAQRPPSGPSAMPRESHRPSSAQSGAATPRRSAPSTPRTSGTVPNTPRAAGASTGSSPKASRATAPGASTTKPTPAPRKSGTTGSSATRSNGASAANQGFSGSHTTRSNGDTSKPVPAPRVHRSTTSNLGGGLGTSGLGTSGLGTSGLGTSGLGTGGLSGRSYMENPFTFTASGLHAHMGAGSTRSRSTTRLDPGSSSTGSSGLGASTARNVSFSVPNAPKVTIRSRPSSAPNMRNPTHTNQQARDPKPNVGLPPRYRSTIRIASATV